MKTRSIWATGILFVLMLCPIALVVRSQVGGTSAPKESYKLIAEKPGVYIVFEREGKRKPPGDDVSDEAVWLRLHNNMRTAISFCAFSILDDKGNPLSYQEAGELGLNYEVEVTDPGKFDRTRFGVPVGNKETGLCHVFTLKTGESIVFTIPKEHLRTGLSVKIPFNYEWEDRNGRDPSHFVYFNSKDVGSKAVAN